MRKKPNRTQKPGIYLDARQPEKPKNRRSGADIRWLRFVKAAMLIAWDGLLLYMIIHSLIDRVFGAVFVGIISAYLGFNLK